jgi:hypothetical protein
MTDKRGDDPQNRVDPSPWWRKGGLVGTAIAIVLAGVGGGLYVAGSGAAKTTPMPTKGAIEGTVIAAADVSQSLFSAPVTTSGSLRMADVQGEVQQHVTATSEPWALCPSARGVAPSPAGIRRMASYNRSQITLYFTGPQERQELERLARHLTGTTTPAKISTARQRGCSPLQPPNWSILGPSITSVARWNSVVQTGTTATVYVVLLFDEETCSVNSRPDAKGAYGIRCPDPRRPNDGGTLVRLSLQKDADGQWRVDDMIIEGTGQ